MKRFAADLHIHTALSPCASEEMTPPAIVAAAFARGLDLIAVCDHNAAGNVAAAQEAAGERVTVIAGVEATTREEVHVLGYFPDAARADRVAEALRKTLPVVPRSKRNPPQLFFDVMGRIVGEERRMLSVASTFSVEQVSALIRGEGGLVVAAHVDRPSYSIFSQLGLFPPGGLFDAIELSAAGYANRRASEFAPLGLATLTASDSHFLSDIGVVHATLEMKAPTFEELALALRGAEGRRCVLA